MTDKKNYDDATGQLADPTRQPLTPLGMLVKGIQEQNRKMAEWTKPRPGTKREADVTLIVPASAKAASSSAGERRADGSAFDVWYWLGIILALSIAMAVPHYLIDAVAGDGTTAALQAQVQAYGGGWLLAALLIGQTALGFAILAAAFIAVATAARVLWEAACHAARSLEAAIKRRIERTIARVTRLFRRQ